ncbi:MAG: GGDEF domain-containing protein [Clostridia bacterium]|nr:GGDEF domain-containing protein [Clostridia bacterium]
MRESKAAATVEAVVKASGDDLQTQMRELKRLIREGKRANDLLLVGAAYCRLAEICNDADDLPGVLANSMKAVTLLQDTGEYELLAKSCSALGYAYTHQGNNQMALFYDERAYSIVKKHRIRGQTRLAVMNNLATGYRALEETQKSIRYGNECLDLLRKEQCEDYDDLVMYSLNLAEYYKDNGELKIAMEILKSLSAYLEKVEYSPFVCDYYLRSAIVSYLSEDVTAGNSYMDTAFTLIPEKTYPLPLYDDLHEVSRLLLNHRDRERAKTILDIMTIYAEKNPGTLEQLFAASMMANYYNTFAEYQLASEYFAKYEALKERQEREQKEMQMTLHRITQKTETEVRKLRRRIQESEALASLEPMTKLLNRSALLRISSEFIESAAKKKQKVGAVFIDIDFFKECNDTYGHAKGDEIIREVARACRKQETANIRFARYGGDEFFGITKGLTDDQVCEVARRICQIIRNADIPNANNPAGGRITLSVGVVNVPITARTDTILEIANYADKALYHAKNAGKNMIFELFRSDGEAKNAETSYIKIDF